MADRKKALRRPRAAHPAGLLTLLADSNTFKVVAALVIGVGENEVPERTGLSVAATQRILRRLTAAGLVATQDGHPVVQLGVVKQAATTATEPVDSGIDVADPDVAVELRKFFRAGRLHTVPASRSKMLLVLDYMASLFEPGRYYSEGEVNKIIHRIHDDHATFRRFLVDRGFLARDKSRYWRAGGTVEVD